MTKAFNVVRYVVKPGADDEFLLLQRSAGDKISGSLRFILLKTGEGQYCNIGEWPSMDLLQEKMPNLIAWLDTYRHLLDDVRLGTGVTDAVSGETVWDTQE